MLFMDLWVFAMTILEEICVGNGERGRRNGWEEVTEKGKFKMSSFKSEGMKGRAVSKSEWVGERGWDGMGAEEEGSNAVEIGARRGSKT